MNRIHESLRDDAVPAGAHADVLQWLSASLDGEISPRERILLDDHLAGCVRCSAIAVQWRSIERAVRVDAKPRTPVGLVDRIMSRLTRPAVVPSAASAASFSSAAPAVPLSSTFAPIRLLKVSAALAAGLVACVGLFGTASQPTGASAAEFKARAPSILESQDPALLRVLERWERGHAAQPTFLELLLPKHSAGRWAESPTMNRKGVLWLLLNAVLWTAFGVAGTWLVARLRAQRPTIGDLADEALVRMEKLELTSDQRRQIATIREQWRTQMVAEERAWLAKLDAAAADADAKVAALLTPDQSRKYRELALGVGSK